MSRVWVELANCPMPGARLFRSGELAAMVGKEGGRYHLSVSCRDRYPTYDEIADARYDLLPKSVRDMAMVLPHPDDYVNLGDVFHLWEVFDHGLPIERGVSMPRTREGEIAWRTSP
jgi:hypothetical protein